VAKRVGPMGHQPVLKGSCWVEDFNPSVRSGSFRSARQLDGPKYGSARPEKNKIKLKKLKKLIF